jgi:hypothetical protein
MHSFADQESNAMKNPTVFRLALAAWVALAALTGCATLSQPTSPCTAWQSAELAWSAVDLQVRQQLANQRAQACLPPPAPPVESMPGEVPPRVPTAPPEQVPLSGWLPREQ